MELAVVAAVSLELGGIFGIEERTMSCLEVFGEAVFLFYS